MDNAQLSEELTAIEGVEDAELSFGETGVTGVRVRLEADADPAGVGRAVQEVMNRHGVRARLGTQPPPPPTASVVALADHVPAVAMSESSFPAGEIAGVALSETGRGLEVSVTGSGGGVESQRCRADDDSIAEAVTLATCRLHGTSAVLVEYARHELAGQQLVTVVIDGGGDGYRSGSAVIGSGFPFAVARAVWAALGA
jgi:hypothetical protein